MTTLQKAALAASPGITVLVLSLGWWALDRLTFGTRLRDLARL